MSGIAVAAKDLPRWHDLTLPALRITGEQAEARTGELVARLADDFRLSDEQRALTLGDGKRSLFANRVHWAIVDLSKARAVEKIVPGRYRITDRGRAILEESPPKLDKAYLSRFPEYLGQSSGAGERDSEGGLPASSSEGTPDEALRVAFRDIEAALRVDVLQKVRSVAPGSFERLVVRLLVAMGFGRGLQDPGRAIGKAGDGGIDGVIDQDGLGLDRVYIQAKRYAADNAVGPGAINEFFGSLDDVKAAKGVFITTSSFTKAAKETATKKSKRIVLVDGDQLARLLVKHKVGVRVEEVFEVKKIDEDFFTEAE
jgi:restriction system protein